MAKARKTTAKPERNEALFELMRGVGDNLESLEQGLRTLLILAAADDCEGPDVHWMAMHLFDKCLVVKAALDEADEKHIKPWRIAHGYERTAAQEIADLEARVARLREKAKNAGARP